MGRGLEAILKRIEEQPDERLIGRYLALVSDLTEEERAQRALALATTLVAKNAKEAMRIAHMVYKANPLNVQAIDVIIEALIKLGRLAKAEVLRNERDKLIERAQTEKLESVSSTLDLKGLSESYGGQPLELDLGVEEGEVAPHELLFTNVHQGPDASEAEEEKTPNAAAEEARDPEPAPTFHLSDVALPAAESKERADLARTFQLADLGDVSRKEGSGERDRGAREFVLFSPRQETSNTTLDRLFEEHQVEVPKTDLGVAVELFDYYWKQGYVAEARELLEQARPVAAHESWWQARKALVEKSALGLTPPPSWPPAKVEGEAHRPDDPDAFWEAVDAELGKLERRREGFLPPASDISHGERQTPRLEPKALDALIEIVRQHAQSRELEEVAWELVSGLWGSAPSPDASELLLRLALTEASPTFFGVYLDGRIAEGRARRALVEARRALEAHPTLEWAEVIAARAQAALRVLGMRQRSWRKEDGLNALQSLLAERPKPRLDTLIAG